MDISGFFYDNWGSIGSFGLATTFAFLGLLCIILLDISKYETIHNSEIENGIDDVDITPNDINLEEKGAIRSKVTLFAKK